MKVQINNHIGLNYWNSIINEVKNFILRLSYGGILAIVIDVSRFELIDNFCDKPCKAIVTLYSYKKAFCCCCYYWEFVINQYYLLLTLTNKSFLVTRQYKSALGRASIALPMFVGIQNIHATVVQWFEVHVCY